MHYVILDLEATCWDQWDRRDNETIEIGALLIDEEQNILSEFEQFVRPLKYPALSTFCTDLTSIQQSDVDQAPYFHTAIEAFKNWFGYGQHDYLLCSWGFYDRKQFESDCQLHGLPTDWLHPHISLKHQYAQIKGLRRPIGMKRALAQEGLPLEGFHHRGIDDARNISKIFLRYFNDWQPMP
ncbi:MAG: 3'-5' exonuclease [Bacteroidota bacterium]